MENMNEEKINITTVDFLDKALLFLKNESAFGLVDYKRPVFPEVEKKLLVRAFYKLEKDGFAYSEKKESDGNTSQRFFISFDGLLALESCPTKWKNRPYRWSAIKENIDSTWTVTKTIGIIINAIVILLFTYLTYINK